ncbi:hypothetical protein V502_00704 [Pseudogymnoascus sp. VKM F-4520 (FW-2644)]|nr:hypothetical protein V502_00704 [Pseudogymnoascus sp. VKM F-4520 (FW-2644)]
MYRLNRNLNQQLEDLNQELDEVRTETVRVTVETVRVTGNHKELLSWTYGINRALINIGQQLVKLDAGLKTLGIQKDETGSRVDEVQEE